VRLRLRFARAGWRGTGPAGGSGGTVLRPLEPEGKGQREEGWGAWCDREGRFRRAGLAGSPWQGGEIWPQTGFLWCGNVTRLACCLSAVIGCGRLAPWCLPGRRRDGRVAAENWPQRDSAGRHGT